ncbi:lytic transglycosylase domain-containing protein [Parapedobacter lycopersici]|uniref:lytic transglycosylase domain-containing protein n=1 Tax=Parapedobacter lycopersici TaxID=1864939 RepID=UPI00214D9635|nr:lytic transglycosylase domain-containing protein [Parapedobacter lycopersici]
MIKKQLLCCSAVLGLVLLSNLYSYNSAVSEEQAVLQQDTISYSDFWLDDINQVRNSPYFASLNFAEENLPLGDKQIEQKMMRYLKAYSRKQWSKLLHRKAQSDLPEVASVLRRYGVPEDFKYIPLVESGLAHGTTSHRGASGYWQFMPSTARAFGLRVDNEVDERQHIEKSTVAAAKYLKSLYRVFNSWTLVAAAYNIGEGNLQRAISRQREDNYFKLKLNRETGSYVYKLISVKEIIEHPGLHRERNKALLADATPDAQEEDHKL